MMSASKSNYASFPYGFRPLIKQDGSSSMLTWLVGEGCCPSLSGRSRRRTVMRLKLVTETRSFPSLEGNCPLEMDCQKPLWPPFLTCFPSGSNAAW
ncbi:hypothetical protein CEXT_282781 [Caerostris extrusa]|uniref:Uncharacterized protein n=1 Tax=Caerostris extrusa TaxID=172846 RepID=A0AAV4P161_CAEEX|nr:hypothetical protein CEXT_282781 [Caerostris extrusa]